MRRISEMRPGRTGESDAQSPRISVLRGALWYYLVVFGTGFVLGPIRILWLVPRVGTRAAELLEMPVMLAVMTVAAQAIVARLQFPPLAWARLGMGFIAFALVLLTEFTVVLQLRGLTLADYLATRDPVSSTVYYLSLVLFAFLPLLVTRR